MKKMSRLLAVTLASAAAALAASCAMMQSTGPMGFFVTSAGSGKGADLGGLAGADAHCQKLASAASAEAGKRTWRAYLSNTAVTPPAPAPAVPAVHARARKDVVRVRRVATALHHAALLVDCGRLGQVIGVVQLRHVACEEFHDSAHGSVTSPVRSWWPMIALPSPLCVQLPQVNAPGPP